MIEGRNEEIARGLERSIRADYLKTYIKEPLDGSIGHLMQIAGMPTEVDDLILLYIFTHIDLLGYLYSGEKTNTSVHAVEYMREYFGRADNRYDLAPKKESSYNVSKMGQKGG